MAIPATSQKQQKNLRQYESIWLAIKNADMGVWVPVRCHQSAVARIKQAVKKEKTKDVAVKKKIGMLRQGSLEITYNPEVVNDKLTGHWIIKFRLTWDGTKL